MRFACNFLGRRTVCLQSSGLLRHVWEMACLMVHVGTVLKYPFVGGPGRYLLTTLAVYASKNP